jgi:hypothetical protein
METFSWRISTMRRKRCRSQGVGVHGSRRWIWGEAAFLCILGTLGLKIPKKLHIKAE